MIQTGHSARPTSNYNSLTQKNEADDMVKIMREKNEYDELNMYIFLMDQCNRK